MYYAAYRIGSWELHHDATLVNPAAAERFSSELSRLLFWVHQASGPIAVGVLTIAVGCGGDRLSGLGARLALLVAQPLAPAAPATRRLNRLPFAGSGGPVVD